MEFEGIRQLHQMLLEKSLETMLDNATKALTPVNHSAETRESLLAYRGLVVLMICVRDRLTLEIPTGVVSLATVENIIMLGDAVPLFH